MQQIGKMSSHIHRLIYLWIFITFLEESYAFQRFSEQPKYTEVNPGQDALLTCKITDHRGSCSWQKDNKPVGIYPKKYEWAAHLHSSHLNGDCSLWIRSATLEFDDGVWECQVTASDFTAQDALTSKPVRLVVRVPPQRPRLEYEGVHIPPGHNITVDSSSVATVKCISRYGNPPAVLKWFLDNQELSPMQPDTNATEPDSPRTWAVSSVIQIPTARERHGEKLKCVALHESYAAKSVAVEAKMDVKYAPTIQIIGTPHMDLEEGKDSLVLRCIADANPPASIVWRRAGRSEIASLQESLELRPVGRRDAGLYTCTAQNSVGTSEPQSVQLDVKYTPRILSAGPDRLTTAPLFTPAAFECVAEGNPPPIFKWFQKINSGAAYLERGREARLVIDNVTYDYQGEYECRATNYINGQERTVPSEPVSLQVVGAPQVLRLHPSMHTLSVHKGETASMSLIVCADPRPRNVAWEWGSLRLEADTAFERYRVDPVSQDSREDCYLSTLHIADVDLHDSRPYYLVVDNERGIDRHAINLIVEGMFTDPLELSYLLGIAGGCLAALLILICLCIYAVRTKKCCFKGRGNFKSSEKDSEKADLKSRSDSTSGGPHLDSIYTTPSGFHHHHAERPGSPEAMKSTTQNELRNSLGHRMINADLIISGRHQQRDLFTGSLGIPDVTTHVGSVIHAFETMARNRTSPPAEQPYEVSTGSVSQTPFKQSTENKTLSKHPHSGSENRQKLVVVAAPPPPQRLRQHMRHRSHDSLSRSPSPSPVAVVPMHIHYDQSVHTLPHVRHTHTVTVSTQPNTTNSGTQTMRIRDSVSGNGNERGSSRGGNNPGSTIGYMKGAESYHNLLDEPESSNFDSINMDDYRKNLFGPQSKIDSKLFHLSGTGNYDDANLRDVDRKQRATTVTATTTTTTTGAAAMATAVATTPYHSANDKSRDRSKRQPEVYLVKNDNNYLVAEHSIPHNSHHNNINNNNNHSNHNNSNSNFHNGIARIDINRNFNDDDLTLLRGTTVSQSFIKNVKIPRKISENSSTSNGFRRGDVRHSAPSGRNYLTSTFKPTSDITDELRIRYTEHNADTILTRRNQNQCALHPNRSTGTASRKQKYTS